MRNILILMILLLGIEYSQAQLMPNGIILSKGEVSSVSESDASNETVVAPAVEPSETSLNWNAETADFADSVAVYQKNYAYNISKRNDFYSAANISNWSGIGASLIGLGLLSAGLTGYGSGYTYAGAGFLAVGLVGFGLSIGFDIAANTYSVRAGFFNQKKIDYQRRHSVLQSGDN